MEPLSPANQQIKDLRRLVRNRRERRQRGVFAAEGPKLVAEAIRSGAAVQTIYVDESTELVVVDGPEPTLVRRGVLAQVLDTKTPQPVAAIVEAPHQSLDGYLKLAGSPLILVLSAVTDPGNAGTLLRAAEATGGCVVFLPGSVDPFSPKVVRASAGSIFRVPFVELAIDPLVASLQQAGVVLYACERLGGAEIGGVNLTGPVAFALGSEAGDIDPVLLDSAERSVSIPMAGDLDSLNVAMTGTVVAYEAFRQRRSPASQNR